MNENNNIEKWVTLKEIQAHLGVGRETILQWIANVICQHIKWATWKFKISEVCVVHSGEAADKTDRQITRRNKAMARAAKAKKKWKYH